jgi:DNA-binding NtrC family response regulator
MEAPVSPARLDGAYHQGTMTTILLIGSDAALLEGLSQTLASASHRCLVARSLPEAAELAASEKPLIVLIERTMATADVSRLPLKAGGACVIYHLAPDLVPAIIPPSLARITVAEVVLPLERQRLIAVVQSVIDRAVVTGRSDRRTPPDNLATPR